MVACCQRNASLRPFELSAEPTTAPAGLMALAVLCGPPNVPRSVMVIVGGAPARTLDGDASLLGCVASWQPVISAAAKHSARNLIVCIGPPHSHLSALMRSTGSSLWLSHRRGATTAPQVDVETIGCCAGDRCRRHDPHRNPKP